MLARIILGIAIWVWIVPASWAGTRVALVIGNGAYRHVVALPNPPNDASDIATSFARIGFSVTRVLDGTFEDVRNALLKFRQQARGADIAVVYYAGHGIEVGGENWLIPVDAELKSDADVDKETIRLRSVMNTISEAHFGLVIVDACRDNPFAAKIQRKNPTRAVDRGLARVQPRKNVLVAYAARDGTTASDGAGRNSPFSGAVLKHLETPGLEIDSFFRNVRDDVMTDTKREQQPFVYGTLSREPIYLVPPQPTEAVLSPNGPANSSNRDLVTDCDRLAAAPFDRDMPSGIVGVKLSGIDILPALVACENATRNFPDVPRFYFEKGRVAHAAKNYKLALQLYERASSLGSSSAMNNLGGLYLDGLGVAKDVNTARAWLEKAAALGNVAAIVALGEMYRTGVGVQVDYVTARKLFDTAAAAGSASAMNNIGVMYENGNGVEVDFAEARRWFERGAAQGDEFAMLNLGEIFQRGYGVTADPDEARKWYAQSAAAGNQEAAKKISDLKQ